MKNVAFCIDVGTFKQRLEALYSHLYVKDKLWGCAKVVVVAGGPKLDDESPDFRYFKSSALLMWLLGYEFPDTILIFMKKQIHFVCSRKKSFVLEVVKTCANVVMHTKNRSDGGCSGMDSVLHAIGSQLELEKEKADSAVIGYLLKEASEGRFFKAWDEKLKSSNFELRDVTMGLSDLLACKEELEIKNMKMAAIWSASVMERVLIPNILDAVDEEKKISHFRLMLHMEEAILNPIRLETKVNAKHVGVCYAPIIQSGGVYDLNYSASSNENNLFYGGGNTIICALGYTFKSYCSNVARTLMIEPSKLQLKAYNVLLKAQESAINALRAGNMVGCVYKAVVSVVTKEAPELISRFKKSAGTGIGLEFYESGFELNSKNNRLLMRGMVFNISLGFHPFNDSKTKKWSILVADIVAIDDEPEVLTSLCSKAASERTYMFNENLESASVAVDRKLVMQTEKLEVTRLHEPVTLEAHLDRFRFSINKGNKKVEAKYVDIKHIFFLPAENKMTALLHFHLCKAKGTTKNKNREFQFQVDILDFLKNEWCGKKSNDPDEIEDDQRLFDCRNKVNNHFHVFVKKVKKIWVRGSVNLEFELPKRELAFRCVQASPWGCMALFMPTFSCLVQVAENTWLVVTLGELEIVKLKKVDRNSLNLIFVFKDSQRPVLEINMVELAALPRIKHCLPIGMNLEFSSRLRR